jgi:methionine-gamma-lyase
MSKKPDGASHHSSETAAVHGGVYDAKFHPVTPPIYQTSTFAFESVAHGAGLFAGSGQGYIYSRMGNPTVEALENVVAELEHGHKSLACGSGMAAVHTVFATMLQKGDHLVCADTVYGPTCTLVEKILPRWGVEADIVDTADLEVVKKAIKPNTKVIYLETPGNPTLVISDIAAISKIAHEHGVQVVVDNTFMSPILQKPFALGADVVLHSLTKFLNGHADVVGGIIVVKNEEQYKVFRGMLNHLGGVLPPFESFLVHRGVKTLALRMERHCENATKIAEWIAKHPAVDWVRFPGLTSHPQYELGKKQMAGPGGLISFELKGGLEAGKILMNSLKLWGLAVSLGGVESLVQHPASMTHASMGPEARARAHITDGLVRLSVGIENPDELIADLEQGLKQAQAGSKDSGEHLHAVS